MTVHPWPLNDTAPGARPAVVWKSGAARGLLIDTPAVPLRFEVALPVETIAETPVAALQAQLQDAQERMRRLESLLVLRGIPMTA